MEEEKYIDIEMPEEEQDGCENIDIDEVVAKKKPNIFKRGWNWVCEHKAPIIAGAVGVLVGVAGKVISDAAKAKDNGDELLLGTSDDNANTDNWSEPEETDDSETEDIFETEE